MERSLTPEANPNGSTLPAKPAGKCRGGAGARVSCGYRNLTSDRNRSVDAGQQLALRSGLNEAASSR